MQHLNHFISVVNTINLTADHFMAASDFYKQKDSYADGFSYFCKAEAMELWKLRSKVKEYIFLRGGKFPQKNASPAIQINWEFNNVLQLLRNMQVSLSESFERTVSELHQAGGHVDAYFLSKIFKYHLKEVREIEKLLDHFKSDKHTVDFDNMLYEEYKDYKNKYCSCKHG